MAKYKETDNGYVKKENGYKVILKDPDFQELREKYQMPVDCPGCGRLMSNWDNKPFFTFGVCSNCQIDWIKGRSLDPDLLKSREKLTNYVKQKIEEKAKRK